VLIQIALATSYNPGISIIYKQYTTLSFSQQLISPLPGLGNSDHLCISYDLIAPSSQVLESDDVPKYNVYCASFDNMKLVLGAVKWETEMTDLSVNDCWDYFSTTFNEIMRTCIPLAKSKYRKNIYMTMIMKNKKNRLWRNYKSPEDFLAFKHASNSLRSLTRQFRIDFEKTLLVTSKLTLNASGNM